MSEDSPVGLLSTKSWAERWEDTVRLARTKVADIDRCVDDTQAELAQRFLGIWPFLPADQDEYDRWRRDGRSDEWLQTNRERSQPVKPDGMTDAEWECWQRPEWTPEEIEGMRKFRRRVRAGSGSSPTA